MRFLFLFLLLSFQTKAIMPDLECPLLKVEDVNGFLHQWHALSTYPKTVLFEETPQKPWNASFAATNLPQSIDETWRIERHNEKALLIFTPVKTHHCAYTLIPPQGHDTFKHPLIFSLNCTLIPAP